MPADIIPVQNTAEFEETELQIINQVLVCSLSLKRRFFSISSFFPSIISDMFHRKTFLGNQMELSSFSSPIFLKRGIERSTYGLND